MLLLIVFLSSSSTTTTLYVAFLLLLFFVLFFSLSSLFLSPLFSSLLYLYGIQLVNSRKRYLVHDEEGARLPGDVVRIEQCRPLSKTKRFRIVEIVQEAERIKHPVSGEPMTKMMV